MSQLQQLLLAHVGYSGWATGQILNACSQLDSDQLDLDCGASHTAFFERFGIYTMVSGSGFGGWKMSRMTGCRAAWPLSIALNISCNRGLNSGRVICAGSSPRPMSS
jgi:hypothetical protein